MTTNLPPVRRAPPKPVERIKRNDPRLWANGAKLCDMYLVYGSCSRSGCTREHRERQMHPDGTPNWADKVPFCYEHYELKNGCSRAPECPLVHGGHELPDYRDPETWGTWASRNESPRPDRMEAESNKSKRNRTLETPAASNPDPETTSPLANQVANTEKGVDTADMSRQSDKRRQGKNRTNNSNESDRDATPTPLEQQASKTSSKDSEEKPHTQNPSSSRDAAKIESDEVIQSSKRHDAPKSEREEVADSKEDGHKNDGMVTTDAPTEPKRRRRSPKPSAMPYIAPRARRLSDRPPSPSGGVSLTSGSSVQRLGRLPAPSVYYPEERVTSSCKSSETKRIPKKRQSTASPAVEEPEAAAIEQGPRKTIFGPHPDSSVPKALASVTSSGPTASRPNSSGIRDQLASNNGPVETEQGLSPGVKAVVKGKDRIEKFMNPQAPPLRSAQSAGVSLPRSSGALATYLQSPQRPAATCESETSNNPATVVPSSPVGQFRAVPPSVNTRCLTDSKRPLIEKSTDPSPVHRAAHLDNGPHEFAATQPSSTPPRSPTRVLAEPSSVSAVESNPNQSLSSSPKLPTPPLSVDGKRSPETEKTEAEKIGELEAEPAIEIDNGAFNYQLDMVNAMGTGFVTSHSKKFSTTALHSQQNFESQSDDQHFMSEPARSRISSISTGSMRPSSDAMTSPGWAAQTSQTVPQSQLLGSATANWPHPSVQPASHRPTPLRVSSIPSGPAEAGRSQGYFTEQIPRFQQNFGPASHQHYMANMISSPYAHSGPQNMQFQNPRPTLGRGFHHQMQSIPAPRNLAVEPTSLPPGGYRIPSLREWKSPICFNCFVPGHPFGLCTAPVLHHTMSQEVERSRQDVLCLAWSRIIVFRSRKDVPIATFEAHRHLYQVMECGAELDSSKLRPLFVVPGSTNERAANRPQQRLHNMMPLNAQNMGPLGRQNMMQPMVDSRMIHATLMVPSQVAPAAAYLPASHVTGLEPAMLSPYSTENNAAVIPDVIASLVSPRLLGTGQHRPQVLPPFPQPGIVTDIPRSTAAPVAAIQTKEELETSCVVVASPDSANEAKMKEVPSEPLQHALPQTEQLCALLRPDPTDEIRVDEQPSEPSKEAPPVFIQAETSHEKDEQPCVDSRPDTTEESKEEEEPSQPPRPITADTTRKEKSRRKKDKQPCTVLDLDVVESEKAAELPAAIIQSEVDTPRTLEPSESKISAQEKQFSKSPASPDAAVNSSFSARRGKNKAKSSTEGAQRHRDPSTSRPKEHPVDLGRVMGSSSVNRISGGDRTTSLDEAPGPSKMTERKSRKRLMAESAAQSKDDGSPSVTKVTAPGTQVEERSSGMLQKRARFAELKRRIKEKRRARNSEQQASRGRLSSENHDTFEYLDTGIHPLSPQEPSSTDGGVSLHRTSHKGKDPRESQNSTKQGMRSATYSSIVKPGSPTSSSGASSSAALSPHRNIACWLCHRVHGGSDCPISENKVFAILDAPPLPRWDPDTPIGLPTPAEIDRLDAMERAHRLDTDPSESSIQEPEVLRQAMIVPKLSKNTEAIKEGAVYQFDKSNHVEIVEFRQNNEHLNYLILEAEDAAHRQGFKEEGPRPKRKEKKRRSPFYEMPTELLTKIFLEAADEDEVWEVVPRFDCDRLGNRVISEFNKDMFYNLRGILGACVRFRLLVEPILFKVVKLKRYNQVTRFVSAINTRSDLAELVRKVHIEYESLGPPDRAFQRYGMRDFYSLNHHKIPVQELAANVTRILEICPNLVVMSGSVFGSIRGLALTWIPGMNSKNNEKLRVLSLVDEVHAAAVAVHFWDTVRRFRSLRNLTITGGLANKYEDFASLLAPIPKWLRSPPRPGDNTFEALQTLDFTASAEITDRTLELVAPRLKSLRHIAVRDCKLVTTAGFMKALTLLPASAALEVIHWSLPEDCYRKHYQPELDRPWQAEGHFCNVIRRFDESVREIVLRTDSTCHEMFENFEAPNLRKFWVVYLRWKHCGGDADFKGAQKRMESAWVESLKAGGLPWLELDPPKGWYISGG